MKDILIFGEFSLAKKLRPCVFQLLTKANYLKSKLDDGAKVKLLILCPNDLSFDEIINELKYYNIDEVIFVKNDNFKEFNSDYYCACIKDIVLEINPKIFLIGGTNIGRTIAPMISNSLHTGLTADCIELDINEEMNLSATRPTFGGELMATIWSKTYPQMATVRENVLKVEKFEENNPAIIFKDYDFKEYKSELSLIKLIKREINNDLANAKIILSGGMGLKNKDGFLKLENLANIMGAQIGASRLAVEAGFASSDVQIGQTGQSVAADLYIAFGISGAIQHLCGIKNCQKIIAVNNDKNAPIFNHCDVGIVDDAALVIEQLENLLSQKV